MKDNVPDQKIQKTVDVLNQCMFMLRLYLDKREPKYFQEFTWAVERLHYLLKGDHHE